MSVESRWIDWYFDIQADRTANVLCCGGGGGGGGHIRFVGGGIQTKTYFYISLDIQMDRWVVERHMEYI